MANLRRKTSKKDEGVLRQLNDDSRIISLLKNAPIILWTVDADLRFTSSFGAGNKLINVDSEKIIGLSLHDFFKGQTDLTPISVHLNALTGLPGHYLYAFKDRVFDSYVEPLRSDKGDIIGVMGWAVDVTEQKLAEEALQKRIIALTRPLDSLTPPKFEDLFNVSEIQAIQDAFAEATGVASIITDVDGRPITKPSNFCRLCLNIIRGTEKGLSNCMHSDAELGKKNPFGPIFQPCLSGGLWDGGAGITAGEYHIANWLIGQVLDDTENEEQMLAYGQSIGANMDEYRKALKEVTRMPRTQFEKISNALYIIARQLSLLALQNVQQARFITERKKVEEDLANERSLLRTLIYTLPDAIYVKDNSGRKTLSNQADLRNIGVPTEEQVLGKTDADLFPAEFASQFMEDEKRIFETNLPLIDHEELIHSADGLDRWILTSKVPLHDREGNIIGLVGIGRDITARKKADEEIRRLNTELEQRVIERTAELEAAMHEIESFAYSVSHDLRAPLRSINGFGQILFEEYSQLLDAQGQSYLERIRSSSLRMSQIIDDLLALSRVTRSELRREPINLSIMAKLILDELINTYPDRLVQTIIQPALIINGDVNLIRIMLENLINNAWKFTSKHASARIEVGRLQLDGKPVYFVRDDGAGFDMAYANKLFNPFQRVHTPSEFEGTGIGLATVQRIIHRHGGKVWADSVLEQGTTIYFTVNS